MKTETQSVMAEQAVRVAIGYYRSNELRKAADICRQVLTTTPNNSNALHLLGVIAHESGESVQAVELIEHAEKIDPGNAEYLNNLGEAYRALRRFYDAESAYRRALARKPEFAAAHNNLGLVLAATARFDQAEQCYRKAIELNPAFARAALNNSILQLLRGDLATGFALYESRFAGADPRQIGTARAVLASLSDTPQWQGQALADKVLLVWTEQGLGDSLMMMRYLPLLEARGVARLIVYCAAPLVRIMRALPCIDEVVSQDCPVPVEGLDYHCSLMSLPFLFGTRLDTVPSAVPYIELPKEFQRKWARRIGGGDKPSVGLVWAGGERSQVEAERSIRLELFSPLVELPGARFISLQKGEHSNQLSSCKWKILDPMKECEDLLDTAALVHHLDVVISVDTAVAHLAGAIGKKVWLLNRFESAWQWMLDREDSPWYPGMRIFRQRENRDWGDVMARVVSAFREAYLETSSPPAGVGKNNSSWTTWFRRRGR